MNPPDGVFASLLDLEPVDDLVAVGPAAPEREGRTYGGQFLAQAMAAAGRTVDEARPVHSLHAYFLRAGDVAVRTRYRVEPVRDGRSFASRQVVADQDGREVFRMLASYQKPEDGPTHQAGDRFPVGSVPPPEQVTTTYDQVALEQMGHPDGGWAGSARPMDIRYLDPPSSAEGTSITRPQLMWMRVTGSVPDDRASHDAGLAYLADSTLIDHVLLPHGLRWHDPRVEGASLDHAMWFHRAARVDQWLLYHQRVEATNGGRGLAIGRFYDTVGQLIATCAQEGLMRISG